jgi:acetyl-CoA/propionyl-CoA carboxylase carboxyl transferase subunit
VPADQLQEAEAKLAAEHQQEAGGLDRARELGVIDEVIDPAATRAALARAIAEAPQRRGSHGNIPL